MKTHPENTWHDVRGMRSEEMSEAAREALKRYGDIIDRDHHITSNHRRASLNTRVAQFLPFAALTGFDAQIEEAGRLTVKRPELSEDEKNELDQTLSQLLNTEPPIRLRLRVFTEDERKPGGDFQIMEKTVKRIDPVQRTMVFEDRSTVSFEDIVKIERI